MKKGFTLIELLAVIVILAIIALIATPIILGIINDAREESNERSVELYASAVRNGIAAHQLRTGNEVTSGTYNESNPLPFEVEYDGQVDCTSVIISEEVKVSLKDCTVNGGDKKYSYGIVEETPDNGETPDSGSTQVYKPQYYYFGYDWKGTVGTTFAPTEAERLTLPPTGEIRYLGYDVTDGVVSAAYVCFKREVNGTEYCLKGYYEGFNTNDYERNKTVLEEVPGASTCSYLGVDSYCIADGLYADANPIGHVYASAFLYSDDVIDVYAECSVNSDGYFVCSE